MKNDLIVWTVRENDYYTILEVFQTKEECEQYAKDNIIKNAKINIRRKRCFLYLNSYCIRSLNLMTRKKSDTIFIKPNIYLKGWICTQIEEFAECEKCEFFSKKVSE
jgi:hypothetical protein